VKPLFSDEEKAQAVRTFLVACHNKKARITNYIEIAKYLNGDRVAMLYPVEKSGSSTYDDYGNYVGSHATYTVQDAQEYYEALVSIVSDTSFLNVTDDMVKKANNQIFHFIHVMQTAGHISMDDKIQMIEPYDWQKLFLSFDKDLVDIRNIVDRHDNEIAKILKSVLDYLKQNKKLLDALQEDYAHYFQSDEGEQTQ
jgi:hypothetical protein